MANLSNVSCVLNVYFSRGILAGSVIYLDF